jgi:deoxyribonuclease (pyrimidine dimer)
MVRVNLVNPEKLADQHLIAEYDEILMLTAYIRKYPELENIPERFCLGKGHMKFFKNKMTYLKKRHEKLKIEMRKRGFQATKSIKLNLFRNENKENWKPNKEDINIITRRIISKLQLKPEFYRYYREHKSADFFISLLKHETNRKTAIN